MTPLHRSVPQRLRRNLRPQARAVVAAIGMTAAFCAFPVFMCVLLRLVSPDPSRLQPALDQIQREQRVFGEWKCREVAR